MGVRHEFSTPKTPQQNRVVERKNRTLRDMTSSMIVSKDLAKRFWDEVVTTTSYVSNHVFHRPGTDKITYEIWKGKKHTVKYFKVFGSSCYVLRDMEHLGKFDKKSDEAIFIRYSTNNRDYWVFNKRTLKMEDFINVAVDDHESRTTQV